LRNIQHHLHCTCQCGSGLKLNCVERIFFPEIDEKTTASRFNKLGGIPRHIFTIKKDPDDLINEALSRTTLKQCIASIGEVESKDDVSHYIIHVKVVSSYQKKRIKFASNYVSKKVAQKFQLSEQNDLRLFLVGGQEFGAFGSLRGYLFEGYAHNILCNGGKFRIRSLQSGDIQHLTIPQTEEVAIHDFSDAIATEKKYYRPLTQNFAAIDSWIPGIGFFQFTVSESHAIKLKPFRDLLEHTKMTQLYFVVPSNIFNSFKQQNYITTNKKVAKKTPKKVTQYVLEIPLHP